MLYDKEFDTREQAEAYAVEVELSGPYSTVLYFDVGYSRKYIVEVWK